MKTTSRFTRRFDRRFGRPALVAILAAVSLGLLLLPGCSTQATAEASVENKTDRSGRRMSVQVATITPQHLISEVTFTGNLLPRRVTSITAEVEGIVQEIANLGMSVEADVDGTHYSEQLGLLPGQEVRKGDVLLKLDRSGFEIDVAVAEAILAKAEADVAELKSWRRPEVIQRLEASLAESQARLKLANADHARFKSLARNSAASQGELEQAAMQAATAAAVLKSQQAILAEAKAGPTEQEVAVMQAQVKQAEAELRQKQRLLEKTTIVAPYDGVITEIHVFEGDHVSPATGALIELLDLRFLVAEVGVPESYLGRVAIQDLAKLKITGSTELVSGLVVGINDKVDPESRSFRIRIAIDNIHRKFKAGQFARVSIDVGGGESKIAVPTRAITFIEGQPGVYLYEDGRVVRVDLTLGISDDQYTEVIDGVSQGDSIVIDDPNLLSDGMLVQRR